MIQTTCHIEESISPFFIEMGKVSNDLLNHALQEGGAITAKIANRKLRENAPSMWNQTTPTTIGQKQITLGTAKERYGDRIKKDGSKANPSNMKAMIKYYLNEDAHLVVIMGRHPSFIPIKYVNGERKGKQGKAVSGTSKGGASNERDIINIFQKLNDGGTKKLSKKASWLLSSTIVYKKNAKGEIVEERPFLGIDNNGKTYPKIRSVTYKRTLFAQEAYNASKSLSVAKAKQIYDSYFDAVMKKIGAN